MLSIHYGGCFTLFFAAQNGFCANMKNLIKYQLDMVFNLLFCSWGIK